MQVILPKAKCPEGHPCSDSYAFLLKKARKFGYGEARLKKELPKDKFDTIVTAAKKRFPNNPRKPAKGAGKSATSAEKRKQRANDKRQKNKVKKATQAKQQADTIARLEKEKADGLARVAALEQAAKSKDDDAKSDASGVPESAAITATRGVAVNAALTGDASDSDV